MKVVVVNRKEGAFSSVLTLDGKEEHIKAIIKTFGKELDCSGSVKFVEVNDRSDFEMQMKNISDHSSLTVIEKSLQEHIYMIKKVVEAMKQTEGHQTLWYDNPGINSILHYGTKKGWLCRLSHTQVQWTVMGVELITIQARLVLDALKKRYSESISEIDISASKMLLAIEGAMANQAESYKVAVWTHGINNASTDYLRDVLCSPHKKTFANEKVWLSALERLDSACCGVLEECEVAK